MNFSCSSSAGRNVVAVAATAVVVICVCPLMHDFKLLLERGRNGLAHSMCVRMMLFYGMSLRLAGTRWSVLYTQIDKPLLAITLLVLVHSPEDRATNVWAVLYCKHTYSCILYHLKMPDRAHSTMTEMQSPPGISRRFMIYIQKSALDCTVVREFVSMAGCSKQKIS